MTTAALLVGLLDRTRPSQRPYHAEIALMTTGLRVDAIRLIALKFELLDDSPRSDPDCRILKSGNNLKRIRAGTGPTLDNMQVLTGPLEIRLLGKVGYVDDQCLALPLAA